MDNHPKYITRYVRWAGPSEGRPARGPGRGSSWAGLGHYVSA